MYAAVCDIMDVMLGCDVDACISVDVHCMIMIVLIVMLKVIMDVIVDVIVDCCQCCYPCTTPMKVGTLRSFAKIQSKWAGLVNGTEKSSTRCYPFECL